MATLRAAHASLFHTGIRPPVRMPVYIHSVQYALFDVPPAVRLAPEFVGPLRNERHAPWVGAFSAQADNVCCRVGVVTLHTDQRVAHDELGFHLGRGARLSALVELAQRRVAAQLSLSMCRTPRLQRASRPAAGCRSRRGTSRNLRASSESRLDPSSRIRMAQDRRAVNTSLRRPGVAVDCSAVEHTYE